MSPGSRRRFGPVERILPVAGVRPPSPSATRVTMPSKRSARSLVVDLRLARQPDALHRHGGVVHLLGAIDQRPALQGASARHPPSPSGGHRPARPAWAVRGRRVAGLPLSGGSRGSRPSVLPAYVDAGAVDARTSRPAPSRVCEASAVNSLGRFRVDRER